jgi:hypothetical protein
MTIPELALLCQVGMINTEDASEGIKLYESTKEASVFGILINGP